MSENTKLVRTFTPAKGTKRTIRCAEDVGKYPDAVGTLYVQKWALENLGVDTDAVEAALEAEEDPNVNLTVTIEVTEAE